jgi:predicted CoA-binding protein
MNHDHYDDSYIRGILNTVKTIAVVGASANPVRPSYFMLRYMTEKGYRVYGINPGYAGKTIFHSPVFATLAEVPEPIDMVDVFRASQYAEAIVDDAITLDPRPKVVWMQLGIRNDAAAAKAEAAGIKVVMNRCPKIEYGRLSSEISWFGVNSRQISARKPVRYGGGVQRLSIGKGPGKSTSG